MSTPEHVSAPALRMYQAALDYLFARTTGAVKLGLERTSALLDALGRPDDRFPSLHVAGTNGKGSSVATAEAVLRGKGLRVGKYTSPHLIDFRERIVVDGRCIGEAEVVEFVARWTPLVEQLGATFFEATTALAFAHFAAAGVDVALVETGLGGRLDSTNVILPRAAGVTTIDYDHTEILGTSLEQIAAEKAGIFKRGRPAVIGEADPSLRSTLARRAGEAGASSIHVVAEELTVEDVVVDARGTAFQLRSARGTTAMRTPLIGRHQAENVAFALTLLRAAGAPYEVTLAEAATYLAGTQVPARFQREGPYIFDVAHNPEGASVLAETLAAVAPPRPVVAVVAILADKDWQRMLRTLAPSVNHLVLTHAPSAPAGRVWDLDVAARYARDLGAAVHAMASLDDALAHARTLGETVLVTGSFHTVGDAMARLPVSPLCR